MLIERKKLKNLDFTLLTVTFLIVIFGLVILSSATHATMARGDDQFAHVKRQSVSIILGIIAMIFFTRIDYNRLVKASKYIYVLNILLLLSVILLGEAHKGAQAWIRFGSFSVQPSEFAKVAMIITFAVYLTNRPGKINSFWDFLPTFAFFGVPLVLILMQPDLGTTLVFIAIYFGMLYISGANPKILLSLILAGALLVAVILYGQLVLGWEYPLKDYQLKRLTIFVDPYQDPLGYGYHVIQSQIALGSGGLWGKGLYEGTQNQLNYLPEQETDFIFSVVGEELGFVGTATALLLYFILVYRGIRIAMEAKDLFGTLIATGVVSMIVFHLVVNIGMTAGIMPITGIPLPLFSYGGTSMIANLSSIGLLLNVHLRRQNLTF